MKIAQIAPLWETVPPTTYGGTERVVYLLCRELTSLGHEVTLYACGGSDVENMRDVDIRVMSPAPLREMGLTFGDPLATQYESEMIARVMRDAGEFDIIHNHLGFSMFPFAAFLGRPMVSTMHNGFQPENLWDQISDAHPGLPLISISNAQRRGRPELNYAGTIYHGLALEAYEPSFNTDNGYLAFLGRFSPEKGPHHAIAMARATGMKLKMAGKINDWEEDFFRSAIAPHLDGEQITFIGELDFNQKLAFLRDARATLCPIEWEEPFGLVMAESMACGTPVLALRRGSVPELVEPGVSGYTADTVEELTEALTRLDTLDRRACSEYAHQRFSAGRMAEEHLSLYHRLISQDPAGKSTAKKSAGDKILYMDPNGWSQRINYL
ncbi:MAG: glycosyltransferase family 4 protein [Candidatus Melainabacteria bacterium]